MDMNLLLVFVILNIVNVIIQTIKSIATIKCGKGVASLVNAVAFGLYTVVTVYMMCELPLGTKALIVALCNLIGVYVVKYFEEKATKEKLWKVEMTVEKGVMTEDLIRNLKAWQVPFNYIENIGQYTLFNVYCEDKDQSEIVKVLAEKVNAKYFVSETKTL